MIQAFEFKPDFWSLKSKLMHFSFFATIGRACFSLTSKFYNAANAVKVNMKTNFSFKSMFWSIHSNFLYLILFDNKR